MTFFPFTQLSAAARQEGLLVAVLIGIAFGFVLERAGFGRADKLAAQFYFRDLRVFKVMFTAIVTAMLGLVIASGFGLANLRDISESIASFTWVWPMIAGGFVLGIGFIISGYCPGTSIVSAASGNLDGAMTVGGVIAGTYVYTRLLDIPAFHQFHGSGDHGSWFLYDLVRLPPAVLAAAVALFAILAFLGADKVDGTRTPVRRVAFSLVIALAVLSLGSQWRTGSPARPDRRDRLSSTSIPAAQLARTMIEEPWTVRNVDPAKAVTGGLAAWNAEPLVIAMKSGAPPPPPPSATPGAVIAKPKKKGGGCSS